MNVEEIYKEIYNTLIQLVNSDESIKLVVLSDPTGELIHFAVRENEGGEETKIRMASATIAATFGGAEIIGEDFKLSEPMFLIYEFKNGDIVITKCQNNTTLALVTDDEANLGAIRVLAKRYSEKLNDLIVNLYKYMREELKTTKLDDELQKM